MMTLGQVLREGKVWDAMPLEDRKKIVALAGIPRTRVAPLKSWVNLSNAEQNAINRVDWSEALQPSIHCDQCEALMINGLFCHETGCPNSRKTWLPERGEWVLFLDCRVCGYPVEVGELCGCSEETGAEPDDSDEQEEN